MAKDEQQQKRHNAVEDVHSEGKGVGNGKVNIANLEAEEHRLVGRVRLPLTV